MHFSLVPVRLCIVFHIHFDVRILLEEGADSGLCGNCAALI